MSKEEKEFNLSEKRETQSTDKKGNPITYKYSEEDVKEFIRRLEYELINEFGGDDGLTFVQDKLRKLAGKSLTEK